MVDRSCWYFSESALQEKLKSVEKILILSFIIKLIIFATLVEFLLADFLLVEQPHTHTHAKLFNNNFSIFNLSFDFILYFYFYSHLNVELVWVGVGASGGISPAQKKGTKSLCQTQKAGRQDGHNASRNFRCSARSNDVPRTSEQPAPRAAGSWTSSSGWTSGRHTTRRWSVRSSRKRSGRSSRAYQEDELQPLTLGFDAKSFGLCDIGDRQREPIGSQWLCPRDQFASRSRVDCYFEEWAEFHFGGERCGARVRILTCALAFTRFWTADRTELRLLFHISRGIGRLLCCCCRFKAHWSLSLFLKSFNNWFLCFHLS